MRSQDQNFNPTTSHLGKGTDSPLAHQHSSSAIHDIVPSIHTYAAVCKPFPFLCRVPNHSLFRSSASVLSTIPTLLFKHRAHDKKLCTEWALSSEVLSEHRNQWMTHYPSASSLPGEEAASQGTNSCCCYYHETDQQQ